MNFFFSTFFFFFIKNKKNNYFIIVASPPGFSGRCIEQGVCTGPPPLSNSIKTALSSTPYPFFFNLFLTHFRLVLLFLLFPSTFPIQIHLIGLATAENLNDITSLKSKSPISYSRFDTLEYLRQQLSL